MSRSLSISKRRVRLSFFITISRSLIGWPISTKPTPALLSIFSTVPLSEFFTCITTLGFSAKRSFTGSFSLIPFRFASIPPCRFANVISSRQVIRPPAEMSCPARMSSSFTNWLTAKKASRKYSAFCTVGTSLPTFPRLWAKALPPSFSVSKLKSIWRRVVSASFTRTGETTLRISLTSPPELTITVPGLIILLPSGYFWVIDSESFPVGTLTCNSQQKSDRAFTPA